MTRNELVEGSDEYCIAGLAMKVRNELGFCMLESAYERALIWELNQAGYTAERQVPIIIPFSFLSSLHLNRILLNGEVLHQTKMKKKYSE